MNTRDTADRIPALDGLRGLAITIVIWHNVVLVAPSYSSSLAIKAYVGLAAAGWVGVTLFLALSGYLITGILLDLAGKPAGWRRFMRRRVLRIFPLYYIFLFIAFVAVPAFGRLPDWLVKDHANQVWYWVYLVNWSAAFGLGGTGLFHFWSLAVEEQFYLLWPLAALYLSSKTLKWVCLLLVITALFARAAIQSGYFPIPEPQTAVYTFTPCRWDALGMGALVKLLQRDPDLSKWWEQRTWVAFLMASLLFLMMVAWRHSFNPWDPVIEVVGHTVAAATAATMVGAASQFSSRVPGWFVGALSGSTLRMLGKYSYAMYVFHYPLMRIVQPRLVDLIPPPGSGRDLLTMTGASLLVVVASCAMGWISWRVLEEPFLRLR